MVLPSRHVCQASRLLEISPTCVCISPASQSPSQKLETTRSLTAKQNTIHTNYYFFYFQQCLSVVSTLCYVQKRLQFLFLASVPTKWSILATMTSLASIQQQVQYNRCTKNCWAPCQKSKWKIFKFSLKSALLKTCKLFVYSA